MGVAWISSLNGLSGSGASREVRPRPQTRRCDLAYECRPVKAGERPTPLTLLADMVSRKPRVLAGKTRSSPPGASAPAAQSTWHWASVRGSSVERIRQDCGNTLDIRSEFVDYPKAVERDDFTAACCPAAAAARTWVRKCPRRCNSGGSPRGLAGSPIQNRKSLLHSQLTTAS